MTDLRAPVAREPIRVLLVDELVEDQEIYGYGLGGLEYDVTIIDYAGAADAASKRKPNVIVLHIMSGAAWGICDELLRASPDVPVIVLTAAVRPDGANRALARAAENCAAFVGKPCSPQDLHVVIRRVIDGERQIELSAGALPGRG